MALATTLLHHNFTFYLLLMRFSGGMLRVCACVEKVAWLTMSATWRCSRMSARFWHLYKWLVLRGS